jgi:predicted ribosomally synthesized peptide with SipW-like signal peptide
MADNGTLTLGVTAILIASLLAGSGTFAYFSDKKTSTGNVFQAGTLDLKLMDNNEPWGDGVTATWTATNMKPGDTLAFTVPFVALGRTGTVTPDHIEITCDYSVFEESPQTESDTDPYTNLYPDKMAKQMIITRCTYAGIDCLTDSNPDRRIEDKDLDGKITFYDLKNDKLDNLPIPPIADGGNFFRLSVKFSEGAGNDFQGDTFDLTMIFTLNQHSSQ